jgi:putative addiction module killer protein
LEGVEVQPVDVLEYVTADRRRPYSEWLQSVRDAKTRFILDKRIANLRRGNLGDFKVFDTLLELRIDYGPGYRIYCGKKGKTFVLLLCGGTKRTQDQDIRTAQAYWRDHQARASQHPL